MKRLSGSGAVAINSRNRSADIRRDFGGEITATSAPLLVTRISSPSATLVSSSEKLRAASVAVMRTIGNTLSASDQRPQQISEAGTGRRDRRGKVGRSEPPRKVGWRRSAG